MGIIVNRVTELHLKHAYFPRIGSRIDLLKELLFCKRMRAGWMCHRGVVTSVQAGTFKVRQRLIATDVFMAKHDDKIVFVCLFVFF